MNTRERFLTSEALASDFDKMATPRTAVTYCDYIAHLIQSTLLSADVRECKLVKSVSAVKYDLHPTQGYFVSTKKTIDVFDRYGTAYRVTIEEVATPPALPPAEALPAYPHLRAACFCPVCGVEKQKGLVSCWSCWRKLEKLSDDVVAAELAEYEADEARAVELFASN